MYVTKLIYHFLVFAVLTSFSASIYAQVNENSGTSLTDEKYYELTDVQILIEEVPIIERENTNDTTIIRDNDASSTGVLSNSIMINDIPVALSLATALAFVPVILTLIPLLLSPNSLLLLFGLLFRKKRKIYGIIYDLKTKKYISLVKIKIYQQESTKFLQEKISDFKGRYGFPLSAGRYRIEIEHDGYKKFSKNIEINTKEDFFAEDIGLSEKYAQNEKSLSSRIASLSSKVLKNAFWISIIGLIFAIVSYIFRQTWLEVALIIFYSFILLSYIYINSFVYRQIYWGTIVDSATNLRLAGTIVRLYSKDKALVDTQIVDSSGRFGFLVEPGEYLLYAYSSGYSFPSKTKNTMQLGDFGLIKIFIKEVKWLDLQIYLDPKSPDNDSRIGNLTDKVKFGLA